MKKIIDPSELDLKQENVVSIKRISKATTGGRNVSFNAVVAIGDGNGHIGIGLGKAKEVVSAVNKAKETAKKNIFKVPIINKTIPHMLQYKYNSCRLVLKPAGPGTGIIAGASARAVLEQVGVSDILVKNLGSTNPINVVKAIEYGLKQLKDPYMVARQRGIKMKELFT